MDIREFNSLTHWGCPTNQTVPSSTFYFTHLESVHHYVPAQIICGGKGHHPVVVHILPTPHLPLRQAVQPASPAPKQCGCDGSLSVAGELLEVASHGLSQLHVAPGDRGEAGQPSLNTEMNALDYYFFFYYYFFLAALSSSWSLFVCRLVGPSVGNVCEKVTFRVSSEWVSEWVSEWLQKFCD